MKYRIKLISIIMIVSLAVLSSCDNKDDKVTEVDNSNNGTVNSVSGKEDNTGAENNEDNTGAENNEDNTGAENNQWKTANSDIIVIDNQDAYDAVVNKKRELSADYVPGDLVSVVDIVPTLLANTEVNQMRSEAAKALKSLFDAALEEIEIQLHARSGYRSYATQKALYEGYVSSHGVAAADTFSAKPGQSEHQTGLVMDISSESVNFLLDESFGTTTEGKWVAENAHKYGFIVRYPKGKENITGYMYEPWHLRYLGVELATSVYESGLTLEEYLIGE